MKNLFILAIIVTLFSCTTSKTVQRPTFLDNQSFYAIGVGAFDGDSPTIRLQDSTFHVRLYGIDAPERMSLYVTKAQPGSEFTGLYLRNLLKHDTLLVLPVYVDQFQRLVCRVYTSDSLDVSRFQVRYGNAWYRQESGMSKGELSELKQLQENAKSDKMGIWGLTGRKYTPAWWRKTYSGWKER